MTLEEFRDSGYEITGENFEEVITTLPLVTDRDCGRSGYDLIDVTYHVSGEGQYDEKYFDEQVNKLLSRIAEKVYDEGDTLGILEDNGEFIPLPIFYSYETGKYEWIENFIDSEIYDSGLLEVGATVFEDASRWDDNTQGRTDDYNEYEVTLKVDWDINVDYAVEYAREAEHESFLKGKYPLTAEQIEDFRKTSIPDMLQSAEQFRAAMQRKAEQQADKASGEGKKKSNKSDFDGR